MCAVAVVKWRQRAYDLAGVAVNMAITVVYRPYKATHKNIISASQGDNPMIQNARGLSPSQLIQSV